MIKASILCALVGFTSCAVIAPALVETGASAQFRSQDNVGNYNFGYNEDHSTGGTFRRETGNALGQVVGSYGLRDADGRIRTVNYVADELGFRASINTNEPGVEPKDPAATLINKGVVVPAAHSPIIAHHAPAFASHAPLALAPAYSAPVPVHASFTGPFSYNPSHYHGAPIVHAPIAAPAVSFPW